MDETWCLLLLSNATYFHYAPVLHLWDLFVVACPECNWIYSSSPLNWTYEKFPVSLKLSGSLLLSWMNVSLLPALSFIYLLLSREDFLHSDVRGLHSWACARSSAFLMPQGADRHHWSCHSTHEAFWFTWDTQLKQYFSLYYTWNGIFQRAVLEEAALPEGMKSKLPLPPSFSCVTHFIRTDSSLRGSWGILSVEFFFFFTSPPDSQCFWRYAFFLPLLSPSSAK